MFRFFKVNGTHSSEDMPPKIPFFTGLKASRTISPTPTNSGPHGSSEAVPATSQQGQGMNLDKKVYSYVYIQYMTILKRFCARFKIVLQKESFAFWYI